LFGFKPSAKFRNKLSELPSLTSVAFTSCMMLKKCPKWAYCTFPERVCPPSLRIQERFLLIQLHEWYVYDNQGITSNNLLEGR
jgi:hypothetical protein